MVETVTKLPIKTEAKPVTYGVNRSWFPMQSLRNEIDRMFADFESGFFTPLRHSLFDYARERVSTPVMSPTVDIVEKDGGFDIKVELPGVEEKDIEVKVVNGGLVIRGDKKEEKEERAKGYVMSERSYGAFERYFGLPDGIDTDKIAATYTKGILTVTLPKTHEAKLQEKKITVKAA